MIWGNYLSASMMAGKELSQSISSASYYKQVGMAADYNADQALKFGEEKAAKIEKMGRAERSRAMVDLVDAGVVPTSGTGQLLMDEIIKNSESDAMAAALEGRLSAINYRYQRNMAKIARKHALIMGPVNAALSFATGSPVGG